MAKLQLRDFNNLFVGAMLMATVAVLATAGISLGLWAGNRRR